MNMLKQSYEEKQVTVKNNTDILISDLTTQINCLEKDVQLKQKYSESLEFAFHEKEKQVSVMNRRLER